mmetsp:Transcript_5558/g.8547  ORF Transcript_5558/g.8547 Transcript_5558/m.8547 type:complete len:207 (-) Transcript_5558:392-1012(-)
MILAIHSFIHPFVHSVSPTVYFRVLCVTTAYVTKKKCDPRDYYYSHRSQPLGVWVGNGMDSSPSGTVPAPARVWSHNPTVARASQAICRTSRVEIELCARCTSVATTFLVFVMGTTAPGSVAKFSNAPTAANCSSYSFLIAESVRSVNSGVVASVILLDASAVRFSNARIAHMRSSAIFDFPHLMRVSQNSELRASFALLAGNLVK